MAIASVSASTQALASYAAQSQAPQIQRPAQPTTQPTTQPNAQPVVNQVQGVQGTAVQGGDRVTLSAQSLPGLGRNKGLQVNHPAPGTTQATAATHVAASKSVTQALQAYVQTSLV